MKLTLEILIFGFIAVVCVARIGFSTWGLYQILKLTGPSTTSFDGWFKFGC